jgi:hypothetical protein
LFLAFVVAVGAAMVKVYEWRQGALYGRSLSDPITTKSRAISFGQLQHEAVPVAMLVTVSSQAYRRDLHGW